MFTTYRDMLDDSSAKPTAAFIGLPPMYHGALEDPNANIEVLIHCTIVPLACFQLTFAYNSPLYAGEGS